MSEHSNVVSIGLQPVERENLSRKIVRPRKTDQEVTGRQQVMIDVSDKCEDEMMIQYLDDLRRCDVCVLRYLVGEGSLEVMWADFYKRGPEEPVNGNIVRDELRFATRCFMWDGGEKSIISARGYAPILREFINKVRRTRTTYWWTFATSPLTIGGVIGLFLVALVFVLELKGNEIPEQLWSILTAVIAFYFGRGSVDTGRHHS